MSVVERAAVYMGKSFTICPYCGCGCGMYLELVAGHMGVAMPSQVQSMGAGRLCLRGWQAGSLIGSAARLMRPQIAREEASWEEAIQTASGGIKSVLDRGRHALGVLCGGHLTNEEAFACRLYAHDILRTPHLDSCARAVDAGSIWGLEHSLCTPYRSPPLAQITRSDVIVCLNSNIRWDAPQAAGYVVEAAGAGSKLVVIDEVVDEGLGDLAALYILHKPGFRGVLLHLLVEAVAGGRRLDAEEQAVLQQAGVETEAQIPQEAAYLAELTILRQASGAEVAQVFAVRSDCNSIGVVDMGVAPVRNGEARGLGAFEMLSGNGGLQGLIVVAEAVEQFVGQQQLRRLRERLQFLLYIGSFDSATAELADVVLPMAGWGECEGSFTCHDGSIWPVCRVISPAGQRRPLAQILNDLSNAHNGSVLPSDTSTLRAQISRQVPSYRSVDWAGLSCTQPSATVPSRDNDIDVVNTVAPIRELPDIGVNGQRPYVLVVRRHEGSWAFDPRVRAAHILAREHADQRSPFVIINPQTCQQLGTREGHSVMVSTAFGSQLLPVKCQAAVPQDVVVLPWQFRDVAHSLAGRPRVDDRTGSAYHQPVAAALELPG